MHYSEDQQVFKFINSRDCTKYADLQNFLYKNNLPFRSRWIFYFYGKSNYIDDNAIFKMGQLGYPDYGCFMDGEVYYWDIYLEGEFDQKKLIQEDLEEEGRVGTEEEIYQIYIKNGFDYVDSQLEHARERDDYRAAKEHYDFQESRFYEKVEDSSYCEACHESPCLCSDRELTSTVHDC